MTAAGQKHLAEFRASWQQFTATVSDVLSSDPIPSGVAGKGREH
jgi:hypothetical protein